jgi:ATP-dependent DNA helicase RecG
MTHVEIQKKLDQLLRLPAETEWVEFKHNNEKPDEIGEYLSAISNAAALHGKKAGYIVWGIENATHKILGTTFQAKQRKIGNEGLEGWLLQLLKPRIDFTIHEFSHSGEQIVLFEIQAANSVPVKFKGEEYIRVGSSKKNLRDFPEKEAKLWHALRSPQVDWSAQIIEQANLSDLAPEAIAFARVQYSEKHPLQSSEIKAWDDVTFLNKAKVCIKGKVTNAAIVLLGKPESSHLLSPAQAQITWVLKDEKNVDKDYQHFDLPMILAGNKLLAKIRNLTIRQLPSGTLFPHEVTQYDTWVIRETLHNCIAHQDYTKGGRVTVVETPSSLLFNNLGAFIPGTVEEMIQSDAPPEIYRNPFLAVAMVNLNMIDTIGSGIKKMFRLQRERSFPMPDYELADTRKVSVRLTGHVLDENYTKLLLGRTELDLMDVIALDKVQKNRPLDEETFKRLKANNLIEGRRPNLFVSAKIAAATGDKASYIKNRAFDKDYYKGLVKAYLQEYSEATRPDLDGLLLKKLSDTLSDNQKKNFIKNLLQEMKNEGGITPEGKARGTKWRMSKTNMEAEH